jgi:lipoprotein-anchoring transpeptidase ErfK/SrfK
MTGRDPTPYARPVRPNPIYMPPFASEPYGYGRARVAALPGSPYGEERGIGRIMDPKFRRQSVDYDGRHAPGTIVIDTPAKFLYLVQPGRRALRYGIGVGRPGFEWAGVKSVSLKREWPDWRPPGQMLKRRPDLLRYMAGGPGNPLGARALYLGSSLYRIHGTNEPHTIGQAVSSGCVRMLNDDVIDLYNRVKVGTKVIVI